MSSVVVIPTYNECDNIEALIRELHRAAPQLSILIVDDNSPDGTGSLVSKAAHVDPLVHLLPRPRKLGLGTAHIAGLKWGLERNFDLILTMDADFSHPPEAIPRLLEATQRDDVVIGSRYIPGGGTRGCTLPRILLSRGANMFARQMLNLMANDVTAGLRVYKRRVIESIDFDSIQSDGYSFLIEMLYICQVAGWRIGEVPILFEDRRFGTSKISKDEVRKALGNVMRLRSEAKSRKRTVKKGHTK